MPKVSVLTPLYNQELFVAQSITSVMKQTHEDWELIIIDDCSTDGSREIADYYADMDDRIRVVKTEVNSGQSKATNYGATFATGEYMAWHHSDDVYHPQFLEKTLATGKDVVFTPYAFINVKGEIGNCPYNLDNLVWNRERQHKTCYICSIGMLYKRSIFEAIGGYDESFETSADWDFALRATKDVDVGLVPEVLSYYREYHYYSNRQRIAESIRNDNRKRIGEGKY